MASNLAKIAAAVLLAAACGTNHSAPRPSPGSIGGSGNYSALEVERPFFWPGEAFHFDISFRGIVGARAVMAVGEPGVEGEREIVILRSRIHSTGVAAAFRDVRDEVETRIAMDTGRPVLHRADIQSASPEAMIETEFGTGPFEIGVSRLGRSPTTYDQTLPDERSAHDLHSLLGALRAWDATPGDEVYAYLLSGRRIWHLTARSGGTEPVDTAFGTREATRIDSVAWRMDSDLEVDPNRDPRRVRLWLADDTTRAPLRIEADTEHGTVNVELIAHDLPDARITARSPR